MKFNTIKSAMFFLFISMAVNLYSQTSVNGKIIDKLGSLPGASIRIKGTSNSASTSFDGGFSLSNVTQGNNILLVSYIGYGSKEIPFTAKKGQVLNLGEIVMEEKEAQNLAEVVVMGSTYRPSQAKALNIKKASATISEVLAADAIGKLPDRNAAEAVQRLQGVSIERDLGEGRFVAVRGTPMQWSSATLNGNRMPSASGDNSNRGIQMDIFPSELIQYVKLSKALTPDLDGDAIGGTIDFITKTSPGRQVLSLNAAAGYADKSQSASYNASIVYGDKITDKLKFITSAVIWNRAAGSDNYRATYNFSAPDPVKSFAINQLQLRDYLAQRRTMGFNAAMDYQFNSNNKIYFKGLYSQYLDQQNVRETYFNFNLKNLQLQARHADYLTDLYSLHLGGESKLSDKFKLEWSLIKARSTFLFNSPDNLKKQDRGYPIVNFLQPMQYGNLSSDGLKYLAIDAPDGIGDAQDRILPYNATGVDASKLRLNQIILSQNTNDETDYRAQIDFNYESSEQLTFKAGTKFLDKKKDIEGKTLVWMPGSAIGIPGAPVIYMNTLQREPFAFNGGFLPEIGAPYNDVLIDQITNNQIDQMYTDAYRKANGIVQVRGANAPGNIASSYSGNENTYASYLMADLKLCDKVRIIAGARNEYNMIAFSGKKIITTTTGSAIEDVKHTNNYNAFLPMLHLKYSFDPNTILRVALTRSFARPDFDDLNPGTIINEVSQTITQGNTNLRPTFSNNADIMFEHYFGDVGIISAGVFYKQLKNLIYENQSLEQINNQIYLKFSPDNLQNASLAGFETGISKRFTELPGFLGKFGFEGNYTYIDSKVEIPEFKKGVQTAVNRTTLPKQAKHIFNAILFFENEVFLARVAGNFKGKYLNTIRTAATPEHYEWFDKNFTVDFSCSCSINKKIRIFLELNNITNQPNRFYHGETARVENESYTSVRGQIGINYNII